jgi:hypothetical protein
MMMPEVTFVVRDFSSRYETISQLVDNLACLISRATRCGWDIVVGGVRMSAHPSLVWRRLALWEEYPQYEVKTMAELIELIIGRVYLVRHRTRFVRMKLEKIFQLQRSVILKSRKRFV